MHKFIIITGASRGIGKATALEAAKQGYDLIVTARTAEKLAELKLEVAEINTELLCQTISGDIGMEETAKAISVVASKMFAAGSECAGLINNAGISKIALLQDMTLSDWNEMIQTNLTSVFLTSRIMIPLFLKQGFGSIVNVSSVWGNVGASTEVAYSTTKGGINAFTKALARELAPSHIRVNAAAFGAIDTEMNHFLSDEDRQALQDEIGMGRFGTPEEAGKLLLDLLINHNYLTGQIVTMDGAWV